MESVYLDFLDDRAPLCFPRSIVVRLPLFKTSLEVLDGERELDSCSPNDVFDDKIKKETNQQSSSMSGGPPKTLPVTFLTREEFLLALNKASQVSFLTAREEAELAKTAGIDLVDQADVNFPVSGRASIYHLLDFCGIDIGSYKDFIEKVWWLCDGFRSKRQTGGGLFPSASKNDSKTDDSHSSSLKRKANDSSPSHDFVTKSAKRMKDDDGDGGCIASSSENSSVPLKDESGIGVEINEETNTLSEKIKKDSEENKQRPIRIPRRRADKVAEPVPPATTGPWGQVIDLHNEFGDPIFAVKTNARPLLPPDLYLIEPKNGVRYESERARRIHAHPLTESEMKEKIQEQERKGAGRCFMTSFWSSSPISYMKNLVNSKDKRGYDPTFERYTSISDLKQVRESLNCRGNKDENGVLGGRDILDRVGEISLPNAPGVRWVLAGGAPFNALTGRFHGLSDFDFFLVIPPESGCYAEDVVAANHTGTRSQFNMDFFPRGLEDPGFARMLVSHHSNKHSTQVKQQQIPGTSSMRSTTADLIQKKNVFRDAVRAFVKALNGAGLVVDVYQRSSKALTLYVLSAEEQKKIHQPNEEEEKRLRSREHDEESKPTKTKHQCLQLMGYFPDIASILTGFDMGSCQVAYDPKSKRCLATPRGKMTLELRTNIVTSHDDRFDIFRIRKYFIRGIGVALPTSCLAADISSDKIYKKRDEYIKNVIRAYRSNQRGYNRHADDMTANSAFGPDRDGMQRAGSPLRDDRPRRLSKPNINREDLPALPQTDHPKLKPVYAREMAGNGHFPFHFDLFDNRVEDLQYTNDNEKTDEENATSRANFDAFKQAYSARTETRRRLEEEYKKTTSLPSIAENLNPEKDFDDIMKSYFRKYVENTTVLERLVNLLRETDLRATGDSGEPFEERIQVREATHSFLHFAGAQATCADLLAREVDTVAVRSAGTALVCAIEMETVKGSPNEQSRNYSLRTTAKNDQQLVKDHKERGGEAVIEESALGLRWSVDKHKSRAIPLSNAEQILGDPHLLGALVASVSEEPLEFSRKRRKGEHFDEHEDVEARRLTAAPGWQGGNRDTVLRGIDTVADLSQFQTSEAMVQALEPRQQNREKRRDLARGDWRPVPGIGENPASALGRISDGGFSIDVLTWGYDFRSLMRRWAQPWCYVTSELEGILHLVVDAEERTAIRYAGEDENQRQNIRSDSIFLGPGAAGVTVNGAANPVPHFPAQILVDANADEPMRQQEVANEADVGPQQGMALEIHQQLIMMNEEDRVDDIEVWGMDVAAEPVVEQEQEAENDDEIQAEENDQNAGEAQQEPAMNNNNEDPLPPGPNTLIQDDTLPLAPLSVERQRLLMRYIAVGEIPDWQQGCGLGFPVPEHLAKPFAFHFRNGQSVALTLKRNHETLDRNLQRIMNITTTRGQGSEETESTNTMGGGSSSSPEKTSTNTNSNAGPTIRLESVWKGNMDERSHVPNNAESKRAKLVDQQQEKDSKTQLAVLDLWPWCKIRDHWFFDKNLFPLDDTLRECAKISELVLED